MTGRSRARDERAEQGEQVDERETLEQRVERLRRENEAMTLELENRMLRARIANLPSIKEL